MSTVAAEDQYGWSYLRKKWIKFSPSGELCLKGNPGPWIQNNPSSHSSVRSLELVFSKNDNEEEIPDSIDKFTELTHLFICFNHFKCLPNTITKLQKLQVLKVECCIYLEELPSNLDQLQSLQHLSLSSCFKLKSVSSVTGLINLQKLELRECYNLKELPDNLGELVKLLYIDISGSWHIKWLPWSITKLPNLRFIFFPFSFRYETLPYNLNESIITSDPVRKYIC